jgi:protein ImuB
VAAATLGRGRTEKRTCPANCPPTWFAHGGREYVIVRARGPERLETAWWRGPDVRRDYFRAVTETGEHFWIYHAAEAGEWHLHGVFS